ncbi:MAG: hypothetical protein MR966_13340 [Lachnospiraceae bacterium]|nr:hypothetical protein [Lachnospiraceae bacterium]
MGLSRAERRREQKAATSAEPTYRLTKTQLEAVKNQAVKEAMDRMRELQKEDHRRRREEAEAIGRQLLKDANVEAFTQVLCISIMVLAEKYNLPGDHLADFAEFACEIYNDDNRTLQDMAAYIKDTYDISIEVREEDDDISMQIS